MSAQPTWWVGDQNPAYADTITVAGVGVDLTAATTVQFRMRPVGSATLKVDQPVTTKDAAGNFTYSWGATDLDTAGQYLVWVEDTTGGKTQTLYEAVITVRAHANSHNYVELEQLKSSAELKGTSFADQDLQLAISAASRMIDRATGRRFWLDTGTANVRYYTPELEQILRIDDIVALTSLRVSRTTDGTFGETWTAGIEFLLEPLNAPSEQPPRPWEQVTLRRYGYPSGQWIHPWFPHGLYRSVEVTGQFGWLAVPDDIQLATTILATKLAKRVREAPFGFAGIGAEGFAARIAATDPQVAPIVAGYSRGRLLV